MITGFSGEPIEAAPVTWEMTPQARDETAGATERRELAEGNCQRKRGAN